MEPVTMPPLQRTSLKLIRWSQKFFFVILLLPKLLLKNSYPFSARSSNTQSIGLYEERRDLPRSCVSLIAARWARRIDSRGSTCQCVVLPWWNCEWKLSLEQSTRPQTFGLDGRFASGSRDDFQNCRLKKLPW